MQESAAAPGARELRALRLRFALWAALMLALVGAYVFAVHGRLALETDILALLPRDQADPAVDAALREFSERAGRKTLFLVGAVREPDARAAGAAFAARLKAARGFADVQYEVQGRLQDTLDAYRPYRAVLLSQRDRARLRAGADGLLQDALRALYTPVGMMRAASPAEDPLGLLSDFLQAQIPALGTLQLAGGVLAVAGEGRHWVLVIAETRDSPFASATQDEVMPALDAAIAAARAAGAEVVSSGLLPHAAYAARKAHQEIATFGGISLAGTILLLLFVHRSMRPVMMSAGSIALGLLAAITVSWWLFGRVHLLTLVFGSSLIGVAADYSTYFLTDAFRVPGRWDGRDAVRHVAPGILLGLATALVAYAALAATPFPALRQIAVFSATGLATACGCVLCLFPLLRPPQAPPVAPWIARRLRAMLPRPLDRSGLLFLAAVILVAAAGLPRLRAVNDLRLLQASPPELIEGEKKVRALMQNATETQFFLVAGASPQETLEREEALRPRLDALQAQGAIASYCALTRALPSLRTQDADAALLLDKVYADGGLMPRMLAALGFDAAASAARLRQYRSDAGRRLQPQAWLQSAAAGAYRHLWLGAVSGGYASVVTLGGIRDLAALRALSEPSQGVRFVDKVGDISALLARYQQITVWIVVAGHLGVLLLFCLRYGIRSALRVVASPALACLGTLGVFGLAGEAANLFGTFALLLVLGIGIDYAIFLREGERSPLSSLIAVLVSAATTLLSFGMLSLSGTPFIHSFGLTLLLGISLAVLIAQALALPANLRPASPASSTSLDS